PELARLTTLPVWSQPVRSPLGPRHEYVEQPPDKSLRYHREESLPAPSQPPHTQLQRLAQSQVSRAYSVIQPKEPSPDSRPMPCMLSPDSAWATHDVAVPRVSSPSVAIPSVT